MIKETIDRIKDAEAKADGLVRDAEAGSRARIRKFMKEKSSRIEAVSRENEALRQERIGTAQKEAGVREAEILARAQAEMNALRAASDKKKEEAVSLIVRTIVG